MTWWVYCYPWWCRASQVAQTVKNLPAMWETQVWSLGREDPVEKGMAAHSSTLAWRVPRAEEPGGLQSTGLHTTEWLTLSLWRCRGGCSVLSVSGHGPLCHAMLLHSDKFHLLLSPGRSSAFLEELMCISFPKTKIMKRLSLFSPAARDLKAKCETQLYYPLGPVKFACFFFTFPPLGLLLLIPRVSFYNFNFIVCSC